MSSGMSAGDGDCWHQVGLVYLVWLGLGGGDPRRGLLNEIPTGEPKER